MLGHVVSLKKNIVITGSHGKTTTTSLIAKILSDSKFRSNYCKWRGSKFFGWKCQTW